jgi:hypothetical protein
MAHNYPLPGMYFSFSFCEFNVHPSVQQPQLTLNMCLACLTLSHIRNHLSVDSTRALLCLGAWSKLGLIRKADIQDAATLPDVKEVNIDTDEELSEVAY